MPRYRVRYLVDCVESGYLYADNEDEAEAMALNREHWPEEMVPIHHKLLTVELEETQEGTEDGAV